MDNGTTTPDERLLGPVQSSRLSGLTGLPASEFEGQTPAALSERLRWVIDPELWLFRRVCGQPESADDAMPKDLRRILAEPLTRRPLTASPSETQDNPRSRSAKLRAVRRL